MTILLLTALLSALGAAFLMYGWLKGQNFVRIATLTLGVMSWLGCAFLIVQKPDTSEQSGDAMANLPAQIQNMEKAQSTGAMFGGGAPQQQPQQKNAGSLDTMAARLAEKLQKDPSNGQGWALLARTYMQIGQYPLAADAYGKAAALLPKDASIKSELDAAKAKMHESAGK